jgi:hAT family C-terminal dimerisation region
LIDKAQRKQSILGEAVQDWIELKISKKHQDRKTLRDKLVFSEAAILSNVLHHKFKGKSLSFQQKATASESLRRMLHSSEEYEIFQQFLGGNGNFDEMLFNDLSPSEFWETFSHFAPNLSKLGLLYTSLPASTAQLERSFSQWSHVHSKSRNRLGADRSKKLFFVYHTLSIQKGKL